MKKYLFLIILLIGLYQVKAQELHEAPSLQVGLSGIKFSKGNLDPEIIAEIIAEKQKEVKVKLIKNMFLDKLRVDNGLFYSYIDQSIEILATEKDEDTRLKNLLENTVNIAFVVGYTDYYIRTLKKDSKEWKSFKTFAQSFLIDTTIFNKDSLTLKEFAKINYSNITGKDFKKASEPEIKSRTNKFVGVLIDLFAEQVRQNEQLKSLGLLRTNYLQNYISMNSYLSLKNYNDDVKAKDFYLPLEDLKSVLNYDQKLIIEKIDSSYKAGIFLVLKPNEEDMLKSYLDKLDNLSKIIVEKGFYEGTKEDKKEYTLTNWDSHNKSNKKDPIEFVKGYRQAESILIFYTNALTRRDLADVVFNQVQKNLDIYMSYYGLIKSLSDKGNNWKEVLKTLSNNTKNSIPDSVLIGTILSQYKKAKSEIDSIKKLSSEEVISLEGLISFLNNLRYTSLNRYENIQKFEKVIKPALNHLGIYSIDFIDLNSSMSDLLYKVPSTVNTVLESAHIKLNLAFIDVFTKIDEFDKVETYSAFLNQLSDAGDVFSDEEMRKSINRIISLVRSYIKVNEDTTKKLVLNLDAEGFLYNLQKTNYNKFRPLQFHFTVGTNTTSFGKDLITSENDTIRNYSFIGEKIGIKLKIVDNSYTRSFSKGETFSYYGNEYVKNLAPREPALSNIHLLAYASGILYNLVNTGTSKSFNYPMVGLGCGLTFYNDLDFNLSFGRPILPDKSFTDKSVPYFFNLGFDIQFIEYYDRVNQKRKANQLQKKIAEASK